MHRVACVQLVLNVQTVSHQSHVQLVIMPLQGLRHVTPVQKSISAHIMACQHQRNAKLGITPPILVSPVVSYVRQDTLALTVESLSHVRLVISVNRVNQTVLHVLRALTAMQGPPLVFRAQLENSASVLHKILSTVQQEHTLARGKPHANRAHLAIVAP